MVQEFPPIRCVVLIVGAALLIIGCSAKEVSPTSSDADASAATASAALSQSLSPDEKLRKEQIEILEKVKHEQIDILEKICEEYEKVTDKKSMREARPKVRDLYDKLTRLNVQFNALPEQCREALTVKELLEKERDATARLVAAKNKAHAVEIGK
jgi:hypothetical protein